MHRPLLRFRMILLQMLYQTCYFEEKFFPLFPFTIQKEVSMSEDDIKIDNSLTHVLFEGYSTRANLGTFRVRGESEVGNVVRALKKLGGLLTGRTECSLEYPVVKAHFEGPPRNLAMLRGMIAVLLGG